VLAESIGLGELLIVLLVIYLILMYVVIMITVIVDVLRSHDLSGAAKAFWVIGLMVLPIVMLIVYLFSRGDGLGMRAHDRNRATNPPPPDPSTAVVDPTAATLTPTEELERAKRLLDEGAISADEYAALKQRILA